MTLYFFIAARVDCAGCGSPGAETAKGVCGLLRQISSSWPRLSPKPLVGYFKHKQKNPQAHGYRCSLHPGVFHSIDFPQGT